MKELLREWKKFLIEQHTFERGYSNWVKNYIISFETIGRTPNLKAYKDTGGIPTIGYGTTIYPDGTRVKMGDEISSEKADEYFIAGLNEAATAVNKRVTKDLNQNQFDALVCLTYNMGSGNLGNSSLLKLVNANPNDPKIKDEFQLYIKDKSDKPLENNKKRRKFESEVYFSPIGKIPPIPAPPPKTNMSVMPLQMTPIKKRKKAAPIKQRKKKI
jgi:lysozyme